MDSIFALNAATKAEDMLEVEISSPTPIIASAGSKSSSYSIQMILGQTPSDGVEPSTSSRRRRRSIIGFIYRLYI
jgi:hypothetical protein